MHPAKRVAIAGGLPAIALLLTACGGGGGSAPPPGGSDTGSYTFTPVQPAEIITDSEVNHGAMAIVEYPF